MAVCLLFPYLALVCDVRRGSATWILVGGESFKNLEMPLPADYVLMREAVPHVRAVIDDLHAAMLNQSTLDRSSHTVLACWITGSFSVAAAWENKRNARQARRHWTILAGDYLKLSKTYPSNKAG